MQNHFELTLGYRNNFSSSKELKKFCKQLRALNLKDQLKPYYDQFRILFLIIGLDNIMQNHYGICY